MGGKDSYGQFTSQYVGTHTSGGVFTGTLTGLTDFFIDGYTSCGVSSGNYPNTIPSPATSCTCTITCTVAGIVPVYTLSFANTNGILVQSTTITDYNYSLSANCGIPECSTTCTSVYNSNCNGISMNTEICSEYYEDYENCSGSPVFVQSYSQKYITASIS